MLMPCWPSALPSAPIKPALGIGDIKHARRKLGVNINALNLNDARLAVGKHRAGDRALLALGFQRQANIAVKRTGRVAASLPTR